MQCDSCQTENGVVQSEIEEREPNALAENKYDKYKNDESKIEGSAACSADSVDDPDWKITATSIPQ